MEIRNIAIIAPVVASLLENLTGSVYLVALWESSSQGLAKLHVFASHPRFSTLEDSLRSCTGKLQFSRPLSIDVCNLINFNGN